MKVFEGLEKIKEPLKNAVLTIGNFDGVHIGHQALFHSVIEKADAINGTAVAMTFEPHPVRVLKKNGYPPIITMYEQKAELIAKIGMDVLICIPFTREFASLSARRFVEQILVRRIGMKAIVVGQDYTFGKDREGNVELLQAFGHEYDFEVIISGWIPGIGSEEERISSTGIRDLVMAGKVDKVRQMLGRYYQIRGTVAAGRNRGGKLLGFPTANIHLQDELCPKTGIYAVTVELEERLLSGVANIGYSPTFDDHIFTIEVHILDFNQNIYNQKLRVNFIQRLRDEIRFSSISELSAQIKRDIEIARKILADRM
jgi:riboflavin kinase/FMN adenylyltransferase